MNGLNYTHIVRTVKLCQEIITSRVLPCSRFTKFINIISSLKSLFARQKEIIIARVIRALDLIFNDVLDDFNKF